METLSDLALIARVHSFSRNHLHLAQKYLTSRQTAVFMALVHVQEIFTNFFRLFNQSRRLGLCGMQNRGFPKKTIPPQLWPNAFFAQLKLGRISISFSSENLLRTD